jgi:hypothetical protein
MTNVDMIGSMQTLNSAAMQIKKQKLQLPCEPGKDLQKSGK